MRARNKTGRRNHGSGNTSRTRGMLAAFFGVLLLVLAACAVILVDNASSERLAEQRRAGKRLTKLLAQARSIGMQYVAARESERSEAKARLVLRANAVASDSMARIQRAIADREVLLARREMAMARMRALRMEQEKLRLAAQREREREELAELKKSVLSLLARKDNEDGMPGDESPKNNTRVDKTQGKLPGMGGAELLPDIEVISPPDLVELEPVPVKPVMKAKEVKAENTGLSAKGVKAGAEAHAGGGGRAEAAHAEIDIPVVEDGPDWPERLVAACRRDLAALVKPGCVLALLDDTGREVLRIGSDEVKKRGEGLTAESTRSFTFKTAKGAKEWRLSVIAGDAGVAPSPSPGEYADMIVEQLELAGAGNLRGVVYDEHGKPLVIFPRNAPGLDVLPLPAKVGKWVAFDAGKEKPAGMISMLATLPPLAPCKWRLGMQVAMPDIDVESRVGAMLRQDMRWTVFLGGALFLFLASLGWTLIRSGDAPGRKSGVHGSNERISLVRKDGARPVGDDARVLLAEVQGGDGDSAGRPRVRVRVGEQRCRPGSLKRLHAMHRGMTVGESCRIMDHARSPLLKELILKVRPSIRKRGEKALVLEDDAGNRLTRARGEITNMVGEEV